MEDGRQFGLSQVCRCRHLAKMCPAIRCDRCGKAGHMARECTRGGGNLKCYDCGEPGHVSRDCPTYDLISPQLLISTLPFSALQYSSRPGFLPLPCPLHKRSMM
eukprot:3249457-Rhodomonas_salina.2